MHGTWHVVGRPNVLDGPVCYLGGIPALLASLSYVPQVREAWPSGSTEDLSLFMLWALTLGLGFWIVYGAIRLDDRRRERDLRHARGHRFCCKIRDLRSRGRCRIHGPDKRRPR
ncbi:PQ-loop domain-containing transporter [Bradyrhizobium japonicum]|uniref:SemiSWEET family sugar transporter n=1 Tax=Bradyrhizobium japonicum TaxID=375 RepID=UPI00090425F6